MVTANRPSFQARSTNTDYKSLVQTTLANSLLDYYMREKRMASVLHRAVEYAVVLGSGFIKMEWNATSGERVDFNEETQTIIYEGDVEFTNLSPYDVWMDSSKEDVDQLDWIVTRSWKNKFDLVAKYPEHQEQIKALQTKSDLLKMKLQSNNEEKTDDVPVYEFWHKRTEAMPDGRYMLYLEDDLVLVDAAMPYRRLPVYRISPSDILGTPFGYTTMFDLLPIQDAINSLYSAALTNQNAFAVQNILIPENSNVTVSQLGGALNAISYNPQDVPGGGKPESLNLTHTPAEIFNFMQQLEQVMETLSGVSSVVRGNPESSLKSGTALALVQSQAIQFISGLQQQYIHLIEDLGTGLIDILKDFAAAPRVAAIVGKSNRTEMKEFKGEDLKSVSRVVVDVGNALSQTVAGRVQIAEQLLQMMPERMTPQSYISVMNTGKLETLTSGIHDELLLIKSENETLVDGSTPVMAIATDDHQLHIKEHRSVLADPVLRQDAELVARTLAHMQEHITALREVDPDLLVAMQQQPLGPEGGSPAAPGAEGANQAGMGGPQAQPDQMAAGQLANSTGSMPQIPTPPDIGQPLTAQELPLTSG